MFGFGVGEAIAAASMIKAAVDGIKSSIGTAKDIGEVANYIDQLFVGKSRLDQAKNKKLAPGQFSIGSIARETVDAKLGEESLYQVSQLIDFRFGHGTWAGILGERQKRIQEFREREKREAAAKAKRRKEMINDLKILFYLIGGAVLICLAGAIYLTIQN